MAVWTCRGCRYTADAPWEGACPECRGFYRGMKIGVDSAEQKLRSTFASAAAQPAVERIPFGIEGLDKVLSGGVVPKKVILFGGFRGTGKSTLLTMAADSLAKRRKVVYASSEEGEESVFEMAKRVGAQNENVVVLGDQNYVEDTLERVKQERPFLTIWDSLQKFNSRAAGGVSGSASQGSVIAKAIKADCHASGRCAIIVNQMARSGEFKGGTDVEHDVDVLMVFAYPKDDDLDAPVEEGIRVLAVDKIRGGRENQKTYWRMNEAGVLEHVPARSVLEDEPRRKYARRGSDD